MILNLEVKKIYGTHCSLSGVYMLVVRLFDMLSFWLVILLTRQETSLFGLNLLLLLQNIVSLPVKIL